MQSPGQELYTAEFSSTDASLVLEVANTTTERRNGLMNRSSLGERRGMLFVFPEEEKRTFWMKNTFIPLDIIFIDSNMTVVNVAEAEPEPNVSEDELTRYRSDGAAKYVIETNKGFSRRFNISEGAEVRLERTGPLPELAEYLPKV